MDRSCFGFFSLYNYEEDVSEPNVQIVLLCVIIAHRPFHHTLFNPKWSGHFYSSITSKRTSWLRQIFHWFCSARTALRLYFFLLFKCSSKTTMLLTKKSQQQKPQNKPKPIKQTNLKSRSKTKLNWLKHSKESFTLQPVYQHWLINPCDNEVSDCGWRQINGLKLCWEGCVCVLVFVRCALKCQAESLLWELLK